MASKGCPATFTSPAAMSLVLHLGKVIGTALPGLQYGPGVGRPARGLTASVSATPGSAQSPRDPARFIPKQSLRHGTQALSLGRIDISHGPPCRVAHRKTSRDLAHAPWCRKPPLCHATRQSTEQTRNASAFRPRRPGRHLGLVNDSPLPCQPCEAASEFGSDAILVQVWVIARRFTHGARF
jgi:hypothetical protein